MLPRKWIKQKDSSALSLLSFRSGSGSQNNKSAKLLAFPSVESSPAASENADPRYQKNIFNRKTAIDEAGNVLQMYYGTKEAQMYRNLGLPMPSVPEMENYTDEETIVEGQPRNYCMIWGIMLSLLLICSTVVILALDLADVIDISNVTDPYT